MEFDETLFSAAIEASMAAAGQADPNGTAGLATLPTDESLDPHDKAVGKVDVHSLGRQTFYPTPNSTNMHADMGEKQIFMSPFPTNYQNYCNVNVGEFDDVGNPSEQRQAEKMVANPVSSCSRPCSRRQ